MQLEASDMERFEKLCLCLDDMKKANEIVGWVRCYRSDFIGAKFFEYANILSLLLNLNLLDYSTVSYYHQQWLFNNIVNILL